jgi:hypothetical protein
LQTAAWRKSDRKTNHCGQQLNNRTLLSDSHLTAQSFSVLRARGMKTMTIVKDIAVQIVDLIVSSG